MSSPYNAKNAWAEDIINFEIQGFIFNVGRIYISFRSDSLPAAGLFLFQSSKPHIR